jgi:chemotaxis protein MotB
MSDQAPPKPEELPVDDTRPGTRGSRVIGAPQQPPSSEGFSLGDVSVAAQEDRGELGSRGHRSGGLLPWLAVVLVVALAALFVVRWYLPLGQELEAKQAELEAANKNVMILTRQVEALESSQSELAEKVAQREKEVNELQKTQEELAAKLDKEIKAGNVAISQARGQLVVDLVDKILFPPGEAELNERGMEVLKQVGETLLKVPDKILQVTGHTDNVPISDKLVGKYPTNWELSTTRASNVVRFLQEQVKIPGERLAAVGRSEFQPIASNKSRDGRRRNRRIEVTLVPFKK